MAEPVSYTKASSYSVATDGLAICIKVLVPHKGGNGRYHSVQGGSMTYNGDAVIVDTSQYMQFFFNLGVSPRGSGAEKVRRACSCPLHWTYIWLGNQQGLGNNILNSIGMEVGLVHTARNHCAEWSGLRRTDANLSESRSMSDKVRRKRGERRKKRRWVFRNINICHVNNRHLGRYM